MRPYKIKIPAGEPYYLSAVGDYVRLKAASVAVTIEASDNGESAEFEQGDDMTFTLFERLTLSHASGVEQEVTVYVGKGTRSSSSKVGGSVSVSNVSAAFGASAVVAVGVVSGVLLAANAARRYLLIQNNSASDIYINFTAAAALTDIKIAAGGVAEWSGFCPTNAINAIAAAAVNVSVVEG